MSFPYTIQYGDTLTLIAHRNGLASWKQIYYLAENEPFRAKRPNPDKIYPGDIVAIPKDAPTTPPPPGLPVPPPPQAVPAVVLSRRFALVQPGDPDEIMNDERDFFFRVLDAENPNVPQIYWLGPRDGFHQVRGKVKFGKENTKRRSTFSLAAPGRAITDLECVAFYVTRYQKGHRGMLSQLTLQLQPHAVPIQVQRPFLPEAGPGPYMRRGQFQRVDHPERWIEDTWAPLAWPW